MCIQNHDCGLLMEYWEYTIEILENSKLKEVETERQKE